MMTILSKKWLRISALAFAFVLLCVVGGVFLEVGKERTEYTNNEVAYFKEIALQVEYGSGMHQIHKWVTELRIKVIGAPTAGDLEALEGTMDDLNTLSEKIHIRHAKEDEEANTEVYFIPHSEFLAKNYVDKNILQSNWGLGIIWWNRLGEINRAVILITTDKTNSAERAHLIREELTQCLGLLNDSWGDSESLFYQGWGTQNLTTRDKKVVQILYDPRIKPNMAEFDVDKALETEALPSVAQWFHNKIQKQSF